MLRVGPHAAKACEPRQIRKKAAVNSVFRVPWDNLIRVGLHKNVSPVVQRGVHGPGEHLNMKWVAFLHGQIFSSKKESRPTFSI